MSASEYWDEIGRPAWYPPRDATLYDHADMARARCRIDPDRYGGFWMIVGLEWVRKDGVIVRVVHAVRDPGVNAPPEDRPDFNAIRWGMINRARDLGCPEHLIHGWQLLHLPL